MKRFVLFMMAFALLLGVSSCTSCNKEKQEMENVVEKTIASDFAYMADNYEAEFVFYESSIMLNEYLDDEDCTGTVMAVTNIFQTVENDSIGEKSLVVMFTHSGELLRIKEIEGFWTEDVVLDTTEIELTYRQAYERLCETDIIKPHSQYCVLRNPLGPYICNAQYIFGSANGTLLFVDAKTGDVRNYNPAFEQPE